MLSSVIRNDSGSSPSGRTICIGSRVSVACRVIDLPPRSTTICTSWPGLVAAKALAKSSVVRMFEPASSMMRSAWSLSPPRKPARLAGVPSPTTRTKQPPFGAVLSVEVSQVARAILLVSQAWAAGLDSLDAAALAVPGHQQAIGIRGIRIDRAQRAPLPRRHNDGRRLGRFLVLLLAACLRGLLISVSLWESAGLRCGGNFCFAVFLYCRLGVRLLLVPLISRFLLALRAGAGGRGGFIQRMNQAFASTSATERTRKAMYLFSTMSRPSQVV